MYIPFSYQIECFDAVENVIVQGIRRALIVMASGIGKTVTMAFLAKRWFTRQGKGRTLFLCHNNNILYQAKTTFKAVHGPDYTYGYFHGEEKNLHHVDFLFASFQTMENYLTFFDPKEFDYVIVDESHHAQADTYRSTIDYFKPKFLLGATATPDRLDQLDIRDIFGKEVFYLPLEEAMARGLVTPVDYRLLSDEISLKEVLETKEGKVSIKELNRRIFIPRRDEEIAKIIARHTSEVVDPRTIIFCTSIKYCEHLAKFVPNSFAIHSEITKKERAVKLELFRQGIIRTILVVDAFNEGIDIPQANVIVFLRSTVSQRIFLQQLGRGLRKSEGKDKVVVLDFVGNCERIRMVYELRKKFEDLDYAYDKEMSGRGGRCHPMTLNIASSGFTETIVPLLKLMERISPTTVSEVEHLAKEYSSKNALPADKVTAGTHKKLWWNCLVCSYEWKATGNSRTNGTGCPACAEKVVTDTNNLAFLYPNLAKEYSQKNPLPANKVVLKGRGRAMYLWECSTCEYEWEAMGHNRAKGTGCPSCAGVIVTEKNNLAVKRPDLAKEYSSKNKLPATKVTAGSGKKVLWECSTCEHAWKTTPAARSGSGSGCPACSGRVITDMNCLTITHPELAKEYSSRNELPVRKIMPGSGKKVLWECSTCEHAWSARVADRTGGRNGCPGCSNRVLTKLNNLAAQYPHLVSEYSDRNELPPDQVIPTCKFKCWWKCLACNHEWEAKPYNRAKSGSGCARCAAVKAHETRRQEALA